MVKVKLKSSLKAVQIALSKLKGSKFYEEEEGAAETRFAEAEAGEEKGETAECDEWDSILSHSLRVSDSEIEVDTERFTVEGIYKSFNSLYIVSDINSSTALSVLPVQEGEFERRKILDGQGNLLSDEDKIDWGLNDSEAEAEVQSSTDISLSFWSESQSQSESSRSTDLVAGIVRDLNTQRFFFSPRISNSNSILEEAKGQRPESSSQRRRRSSHHNVVIKPEAKPDPEAEEEVEETEADTDIEAEAEVEAGDYCGKSVTEESDNNSEHDKFVKESVAIMMYSTDPYIDFKKSMLEMIEAHNLNIRDWSSLQELLCCYLKLNHNTAHKFIVAAFLDLLNYAVSSASNAAQIQPEA
ncbi:hypothetical protein SUGI_0297870 [Cryptomeria japonica]|uniref:transcription repressor OFP18 n=1 Tax=Cryptomeria japonica TaxID=3369 RepID=UPI002408DED8|nr:transcription repressor OFP18 [Cryptomeria japonica]GLJ17202.1 hypothetical protein SUGI_0297870 [Cryptomeria japonica]